VGAGLGGGSADAAFTLKSLNTLFELNLSDETLAAYAAKLGSDCPFFVYNKPMFGEGRGEILTPYDAPCMDDLFGAKPRYKIDTRTFPIHVSTAEAYRGVRPSVEGKGLKNLLSLPIEQWKDVIVNDFEKSVFEKYPQLAAEKQKLYDEGAVFAQMSGSGSSIYGIFPC
jgi:4-diphosphocytidyl-2-C-methyl-D-erythritol kinase